MKINLKWASLIIVGSVAVAVATAYVLPKRYKSWFVLTIYTKYFQNPLVKDFVSEVQDPSELRAQRESLIRQAFDETFLDTIGDKHGFYKFAADDPKRSREREQLLRRIEVLPLNTTTFKVSFLGRTGDETLQTTRELLDQVSRVLLSERRRNLTNLRDTVRSQMNSMGLPVAMTADPMGTVGASALQAELARLELDIAAKSKQFTPKHPTIARLRAREAAIRRSLESPTKSLAGQDHMEPRQGADIASLDVYRDLLKKENYLTIAIDMESEKQITSFALLERPQVPAGPTFPRRSIFALWGALIGILTCVGLSVYREAIARRSAAVANREAERLGTVRLGSLPTLEWREGMTIPRRNPSPKALSREWN